MASSRRTTSGVEMIATAHQLTADLGEAARLALVAGVDSELPRTVAFGAPLEDALDDGRVDDDAAGRDRGPGPPDEVPPRAVRASVRRDAAAMTALETLAADEASRGPRPRRAVAGPRQERRSAAARTGRTGGWRSSGRSPTAPATCSATTATWSTWRRCARCGRASTRSASSATARSSQPGDELSGRRTILDALRDVLRRRRGRATRAGPGSPAGPTRRSPPPSSSPARSDVAILVLGERSGLTDDSTTGEFRDRSTLGFHGRQQELLEAVVATGTPVVLVVVSGRPLALEWAARHCSAILLAWVPGDAGPDAIADVLIGAANPGGKLPVSIPRNVGQVPVTYRHHPTGGHSQPKGDYVDGPVAPLWPFGFGLSYTTFAARPVCGSTATTSPTDGGELHGQRRRREHRRPSGRRGRPAVRPRRRGDASPARSSSCAGSGA